MKNKSKFKIHQLSHYDMDGIGCMIPIHILTKNKNYIYTYSNVSYDKITEEVKNLPNADLYFITDLNFKEDDLKLLLEHIKEGKNIIYIDHHVYNESALEVISKLKTYKNFKFIHSIEKSATKLTFEFLENKIDIYIKDFKENILNLIDLINTYDIWQIKKDNFKEAFDLNKCFWEYKIPDFMIKLELNDWKIPEEFKTFIKNNKEWKEKRYLELKNDNLLVQNNGILFVGDIKLASDMTFDFPNNNVYVAVDFKNYKLSIRLNENFNNIEELRNKILDFVKDDVINAGGHKTAFGITYKKDINLLDKLSSLLKFIEENL